jgi:two-component system, OmpR family, response regulator RpaA
MDKQGRDKWTDSHWPTVLCIDDDPQVVHTIELRLRDYEVEVLSAYHGMHGFWQAMTQCPDLIITDMRMPQGSGDYLVQCLRRNSETSKIPIIVLTGHRDPELQRHMHLLGAQEFVTKPVPFQDLLQIIGKHVTLRKRSAELAAAPAAS